MPLATLPSPVTWASGPFKASLLRAQVSDAIQFLTQPPAFSGSQQATAQSVPNTTEFAVNLDTEQWDNYGGHSIIEDGAHYYPAVQGWYLCEAVAPLNYTGGTGIYSVQIGGVQTDSPVRQYAGQVIPNPATAPCGVAAKLMRGFYTIPLQSATISGDNMGIYVYQSSGGAQNMQITATRYAQFTCKWVSALSGTPGLPVPPLASWPVPPAYCTSVFANANIRDTIRFLIYPPACNYSYIAGTATLASQASLPVTGTTVVLDTKDFDNYSCYNTGTGVWTAPVAGYWYAYFALNLGTGGTSVAAAAGLTITSSSYNGGTTFTWWGGTMGTQPSSTTGAVVRRRLRLNAGDTVAAAGFQHDSGAGNATIGGALPNCSTFIMVWQGI